MTIDFSKHVVLREARRLWDLGFAIHWLHPRSKRPVESGWTTGPRKSWEELERSYRPGMNVGVRTGEPSRIGDGYLAVIDVDVKSEDRRHREEAEDAALEILGFARAPEVRSGRGNGSRHYYVVTDAPFKTFNPAQSAEMVRVRMPSKKPSKEEIAKLSEADLEAGWRLSRAWEVSLYSSGRQVVLPPSIHPDTGEGYRWAKELRAARDLPRLPMESLLPREEGAAVYTNYSVSFGSSGAAGNPGTGGVEGDTSGQRAPARVAPERSEGAAERLDFQVEPVDLGWLPISEEVRAAIVHGEGVDDRSGYLLRAATALFSAELSQNEVLTVLTDPKTFLGQCAYDHAKTKNRARAAEWVYRYTLRKVLVERSPKGIFASTPAPSRKLSPEEQARQTEEIEEDRHWSQDIIRTQGMAPAKLVQNLVLILGNDVGQKVVKRDLFAYRDTYDCDTPWGAKKGDVISDDDLPKIKHWLGQKYGFEPANTLISDSLVVLAHQNAFDPVRDGLEALPEWDGEKRLDTWLARNFEAEGDPEYLAQVFRKWMVAMVLRVYQPGAKFDWMPIFEGAQGIGKSSFGRLLVGDKFFLDWLPNLADKDAALSLQGMWGVEMGELSQFRRNELENIKAFITRTVDKMRPPYGRRLIESPRRCVFFGTTNRKTYLTDDTGNRRFKPVIVGSLDFRALRTERAQLFAEAKSLLDKREIDEMGLELIGSARVYEKEIQAAKMIEDDSHAMEEAMGDFVEKVTRGLVDFDLEGFRILDLFEGAGPLTKWKPDNRNYQNASKMLKRLDAEMRKVNGLRVWKLPISGKKPPTPGTTKKRNNSKEVNFY